MRAFLFSIAVVCTACGSSSSKSTTPSEQAASSPSVKPNTIAVVGTVGGASFAMTCSDPTQDAGGASYAARTDGGFRIKCTDAATGLEVSASGPLKSGDTTVTQDESVARIGLVTPPAAPDQPPFDIITTSSSSRDDATRAEGTINIETWDDATGHVIGGAKMTWAKDKKGSEGNVTILFDVIVPAP